MAKRLTLEEREAKKAADKARKEQLKQDYDNRKAELKANALKDIELTSLERFQITAEYYSSLWPSTSRNSEVDFTKFLRYNKNALAFLGIEYEISTMELALILRPSQMVGCAPLISPSNGKPCGNIIVKSRYQDDIDGMLPLINHDIDLKYCEDMPLNKSPLVHPPLYIECMRYIKRYKEAQKKRWQKFANIPKTQTFPSASTRWTQYALTSYDPNKTLQYPNRVNRLILDHPEWLQLTYVLTLALAEMESPRTPHQSKMEYAEKVSKLRQSIPYHKLRPVREIRLHGSDPQNIKELKNIANNILNHTSSTSCAWAFNITKFFERYVQYLFEQVMTNVGGKVISNQHYPITGPRPKWCLKYIEPDVVLQFADKIIIADAKYKSHLLNTDNDSEKLRISFREDLHQVLGYSALNKNPDKTILLCYPHAQLRDIHMEIRNPINGNIANVFLMGVPIKKNLLEETKEKLSEIISFKR